MGVISVLIAILESCWKNYWIWSRLFFVNSIAKSDWVSTEKGINPHMELLINRGWTVNPLPQLFWPHKQPQTCVEYVETADAESAEKQVRRSGNDHKPTENVIKSFKFRLTCRGSQVRVLYRPPDKSLRAARLWGIFCCPEMEFSLIFGLIWD